MFQTFQHKSVRIFKTELLLLLSLNKSNLQHELLDKRQTANKQQYYCRKTTVHYEVKFEQKKRQNFFVVYVVCYIYIYIYIFIYVN